MNTFKNNNNTMKARDLKLTNDVLFKFVFGREERKNLTISFLNDLLHAELNHEIEDLKFECLPPLNQPVSDNFQPADLFFYSVSFSATFNA